MKDGEKTASEQTRATLEQRQAAIDATEAILGVAEAHAEEMGASDDAQASAQAQIASLIQQREQYPLLRAQIDEYITKLQAIPGTVPTHIQVLIDQGDLDRAEYLLNLLVRQRTATVTVLTAGGTRQADQRAGVPSAEPPRAPVIPAGVALEKSAPLTINMNGSLYGTPPEDFAVQMAEVAARVQAGQS